ncbi:hypothetical protein M404DRAFT_120908, partial [Pisolithus tinctorius Marx 270]
AWSGTCCLEKENSADLQEVIEAMVVWYRKSTLTIAYLADVSENNSIASSKWFRRRRTLLVPRAVLFYTQNLSLYKNLESPNRKADRAVLEDLESTAGNSIPVSDGFFSEDGRARSRLQWPGIVMANQPS